MTRKKSAATATSQQSPVLSAVDRSSRTSSASRDGSPGSPEHFTRRLGTAAGNSLNATLGGRNGNGGRGLSPISVPVANRPTSPAPRGGPSPRREGISYASALRGVSPTFDLPAAAGRSMPLSTLVSPTIPTSVRPAHAPVVPAVAVPPTPTRPDPRRSEPAPTDAPSPRPPREAGGATSTTGGAAAATSTTGEAAQSGPPGGRGTEEGKEAERAGDSAGAGGGAGGRDDRDDRGNKDREIRDLLTARPPEDGSGVRFKTLHPRTGVPSVGHFHEDEVTVYPYISTANCGPGASDGPYQGLYDPAYYREGGDDFLHFHGFFPALPESLVETGPYPRYDLPQTQYRFDSFRYFTGGEPIEVLDRYRLHSTTGGERHPDRYAWYCGNREVLGRIFTRIVTTVQDYSRRGGKGLPSILTQDHYVLNFRITSAMADDPSSWFTWAMFAKLRGFLYTHYFNNAEFMFNDETHPKEELVSLVPDWLSKEDIEGYMNTATRDRLVQLCLDNWLKVCVSREVVVSADLRKNARARLTWMVNVHNDPVNRALRQVSYLTAVVEEPIQKGGVPSPFYSFLTQEMMRIGAMVMGLTEYRLKYPNPLRQMIVYHLQEFKELKKNHGGSVMNFFPNYFNPPALDDPEGFAPVVKQLGVYIAAMNQLIRNRDLYRRDIKKMKAKDPSLSEDADPRLLPFRKMSAQVVKIREKYDALLQTDYGQGVNHEGWSIPKQPVPDWVPVYTTSQLHKALLKKIDTTSAKGRRDVLKASILSPTLKTARQLAKEMETTMAYQNQLHGVSRYNQEMRALSRYHPRRLGYETRMTAGRDYNLPRYQGVPTSHLVEPTSDSEGESVDAPSEEQSENEEDEESDSSSPDSPDEPYRPTDPRHRLTGIIGLPKIKKSSSSSSSSKKRPRSSLKKKKGRSSDKYKKVHFAGNKSARTKYVEPSLQQIKKAKRVNNIHFEEGAQIAEKQIRRINKAERELETHRKTIRVNAKKVETLPPALTTRSKVPSTRDLVSPLPVAPPLADLRRQRKDKRKRDPAPADNDGDDEELPDPELFAGYDQEQGGDRANSDGGGNDGGSDNNDHTDEDVDAGDESHSDGSGQDGGNGRRPPGGDGGDDPDDSDDDDDDGGGDDDEDDIFDLSEDDDGSPLARPLPASSRSRSSSAAKGLTKGDLKNVLLGLTDAITSSKSSSAAARSSTPSTRGQLSPPKYEPHKAHQTPTSYMNLYFVWARALRLDTSLQAQYLIYAVSGDIIAQKALQKVQALRDKGHLKDPRHFLVALTEAFLDATSVPEATLISRRARLREVQKKADESIGMFLRRFEAAWNLAYEGADPDDPREKNLALNAAIEEDVRQLVIRDNSVRLTADPHMKDIFSSPYVPFRSMIEVLYAARNNEDSLRQAQSQLIDAKVDRMKREHLGILSKPLDSNDVELTYDDATGRQIYKHRVDLLSNPGLRTETIRTLKAIRDRGTNMSTSHLVFTDDELEAHEPSRKRQRLNKAKKKKKHSNSAEYEEDEGNIQVNTVGRPQPPKKKTDKPAQKSPKPQQYYGPCAHHPNSCNSPYHDWEYCPRNPDGVRFQEAQRGKTGAHPSYPYGQDYGVGIRYGPTDSNKNGTGGGGGGNKNGGPPAPKQENKPPGHAVHPSRQNNVYVRNIQIVEGMKVIDTPLLRRVYVNALDQPAYHIKCDINGTPQSALGDTGSGCNLITSKNLRKIGYHGVLGEKPNARVLVADNTEAVVLGQVRLPVTVFDDDSTAYTHTLTFIVVGDLNVPAILGTQALEYFFESLLFAERKFRVKKDLRKDRKYLKPLPPIDREKQSYLYVDVGTHIPPQGLRAVSVRFNANILRSDPKATVIVEPEAVYAKSGFPVPITFVTHVQDGHGLIPGKYTLWIRNPSSKPLTLTRNTIVGVATLAGEPAQYMRDVRMTAAYTEDDPMEDIPAKNSSSVTEIHNDFDLMEDDAPDLLVTINNVEA